MKHHIALAEGIPTLADFTRDFDISDGFFRDDIVVVVAAAIFLSLGDLVLRTTRALKVLARGLPAQLLTLIMYCVGSGSILAFRGRPAHHPPLEGFSCCNRHLC